MDAELYGCKPFGARAHYKPWHQRDCMLHSSRQVFQSQRKRWLALSENLQPLLHNSPEDLLTASAPIESLDDVVE
jgi:hypothetical protein